MLILDPHASLGDNVATFPVQAVIPGISCEGRGAGAPSCCAAAKLECRRFDATLSLASTGLLSQDRPLVGRDA